MFLSKILEKIQETRVKVSQGSVTVFQKMVNCEIARTKLANTQLNKLKLGAKNRIETTLRIIKNIFQNEEFPQKLLPTTKQKAKIRNSIVENMSTDIRISKTQLSKIIQ